ncbi:3-hydroxybutyrate dehydrogenase [Gottfriedia acidiceleris]|uniref:3-hydroxybutyrate dehydrogenase n=1 Tax=Gottfriedia acidiceleris TaxID=371036 RepID=UPI00101C4DB1|nr:3-hydroxybutyrate dehydrogenase [Gottfriedia acidiceleris]
MLSEKVALITGAGSGIGFEIAKTFAEQGATVVLTDLNEENVQNSANSLQELGFNAIGYACDVTNEEQVVDAFHKVIDQFGELHILINNAGLQYVSSIEDFPTEKFELLIKVMLTAPFISIKHVFPIMKKQKYGRIINMASINGLIGFAGKAAYNSAKHGVIGLTKVAALEGATDGITVNAICPGYVDTPLVQNQLADLAKSRNVPIESVIEEVIYPLVPQKRLLTVKEIANYTVFLASEYTGGVTGQANVIDAGYTVQ